MVVTVASIADGDCGGSACVVFIVVVAVVDVVIVTAGVGGSVDNAWIGIVCVWVVLQLLLLLSLMLLSLLL